MDQVVVWVLGVLQGLILIVVSAGLSALRLILRDFRAELKDLDRRITTAEARVAHHAQSLDRAEHELIDRTLGVREELKLLRSLLESKFAAQDEKWADLFKSYDLMRRK